MPAVFTVSKAIRLFAIGFVIMFFGIAVNKGIGLISIGVIISFFGAGICALALFLGVISWFLWLLQLLR